MCEGFLMSALIGTLVGLAELVSKYPWSVGRILKCSSGILYLAINAIAATVAYLLAVDLKWFEELAALREVWRGLIVGLLSMAILRSAFLNVNTGGQTFSAGLNIIVDIFRGKAERSLDQQLGTHKLSRADRFADLSFSQSREYLLTIAMETLSSLSPSERDAFVNAFERIATSSVDELTKSLLVTMAVTDVAGETLADELLTRARNNYPARPDAIEAGVEGDLSQLRDLRAEIMQQY